jgi:hypothetical protein
MNQNKNIEKGKLWNMDLYLVWECVWLDDGIYPEF